MNETQQQLIRIIANQLFDKSIDLPETVDWCALFNEAQRQAVFPIVYSCVAKLYPDVFAGEEYRKYRQELYAHYANAVRNLNSHNELHRLLLSNGIQYVVIKGQASAAYYPKTVVRSTGDVDFLVEKNDCLKVDAILSKANYIRDTASEHHGFHWTYRREDEVLEMHWNLPGIPKNDHIIKQYTSTIISDAILTENQNGAFRVPSTFHHGLVLLLHSLSHLTSTGMGMRHLLDWLVFENSFSEDGFIRLFAQPLKEIGLWKYAQVITRIGILFFGCEERTWCHDANEELCSGILEDIISSGNFGKEDTSRKLQAKLIRNTETRKITKGSMMQNLIANVNARAKKAFPSSARYQVLLPIGWCAVGIEYVQWINSKNGKQLDRNLISEAKRRQELYSKLKLFVR